MDLENCIVQNANIYKRMKRHQSRKDQVKTFKKYFSQRELQEFEDKALEILNFYGAENLIPQELVRYLKNSISNNG